MADKKIKVVIAINNMIIGGAQRLVVDQLRYFDNDKFDYSLVVLSKFPGQKDFFSELPSGLKIYQFDFKNFISWPEWFKLFRTLKKIKPDVVSSSLFLSNTIIRFLKLFLGYEVIITEHNTHQYNKGTLKILVDKFLAKFTYKIVAVSETVKMYFMNEYGIKEDKLKVIYNGIDLNSIKEVRSEDILQSKIILSVGRLVKQKNNALLIDAFAKFSKKYSDYKLIIVGDGNLQEKLLEQIHDLNLEDRVSLPGSTKDVYQYYKQADVFALTSHFEGFCLTAMEALAFGIPVVSTKVAGPVDYIKDGYNGLLVSYDAQEIADKLGKMADLDEVQRAQYKQNCQATAEDFDIGQQVKKFEDLFLAALKK
jgi:glycosyltransferase involved in cell wall biosynthesis